MIEIIVFFLIMWTLGVGIGKFQGILRSGIGISDTGNRDHIQRSAIIGRQKNTEGSWCR